jgi:hypothetical protein
MLARMPTSAKSHLRAFLKLSPERAIKYNIGFIPKKYDKRNF